MENVKRPGWLEYVEAYVRVCGIFLPTRYVWRPFELVEFDRCQVDGALVSDSTRSMKRHAGHRLVNAKTRVGLFELFLVWVRWI